MLWLGAAGAPCRGQRGVRGVGLLQVTVPQRRVAGVGPVDHVAVEVMDQAGAGAKVCASEPMWLTCWARRESETATSEATKELT